MSKGNYHCLCGGQFAMRSLHTHTSSCSDWLSVHQKPFPYMKYSRKKEHYVPSAKENVDYLQCKVCLGLGFDTRFSRLKQHVEKHGLSCEEYESRYGQPVRLQKTLVRRKKTTQAKYGVDNVFQSDTIKEKIKETNLERYGVEHTSQSDDVNDKRKQTMLDKYGVENYFELSGEVQKAFERKYGVKNPQQVVAIANRTKQTNLDRYGVEYYVTTDAFKEKMKKTSQERYGVDHPMQNQEIQDRQIESVRAKYGVDNPLSDPTIWQKSYQSNLANHGGVHSSQTAEVRERCRQTCLEKYGVDNPAKSDEVKQKIIEVWLKNYGVPFPPNSLWQNRTNSFPNKLEQRVDAMTHDCLVYSGDHSYWISPKGTNKAKNPDFILLTSQQLDAYRKGTDLNLLRTHSVVEVFGDYWHSPAKTGKDRVTHKQEVIAFYKKANVRCLVLWESEVNQHPKRSQERIARFLGFLA